MIIPSIDLMSGQSVQLIGGRDKALDAGDPIPIAETFRLAGEIAVVDLDAALGKGDNRETMRKLLDVAQCRVGGGIRSVRDAVEWLDAGAPKIVMGTAATPDVLRQLPAERIVAALDAYNDEVVVEGWRKKTGRTIFERMEALKGLVGGFLVTFVEKEGRLGGVDLERVKKLVDASGHARLTVAGGITTAEEVAAVDRLGADAQVGMALYTQKMDFAEAIAAPMQSDRPDGLWPTVVTDESGVALGLVYSDLASLKEAVKRRMGVYHSRSRGLWVKGLTSGATQELLRIDLDCDRDALRYVVCQRGEGFCHLDTRSCWGETGGLGKLARTLAARRDSAPEGSYTKRLFDDPVLLSKKLVEEARELAEAETPEDVAWETADVLYFAFATMARSGVALEDVEKVLDRRSLKLTRRPGDAKDEEETP